MLMPSNPYGCTSYLNMRDIPLHQNRKRDSPLSKYAIKHFEGLNLPARIFDSNRFPNLHWNAEKTITNLGIVSNPRPPSNFFIRLFKRKGRSVRAIRGHGHPPCPASTRNFASCVPLKKQPFSKSRLTPGN